MNKIEILYLDIIRKNLGIDYDTGICYPDKVVFKISKITEDISIKFYDWMKKNDTIENAEKYVNHTDIDMFKIFIDSNF